LNPNQCRVVLRPRGPLEVFDLTVRFARVHAPALWRLALWTILPWAPIFAGLCWYFEGHLALFIIPIALGPLVQGAYTILGGRLLFSDHVELTPLARESASTGLRLLPLWFMYGVFTLVSAVACFYALPLVQVAGLFVTEAVLLERAHMGKAIQRSVAVAGAGLGHACVAVGLRWAIALWGALVCESLGQFLFDFVLQLGQPFGSLFAGQATPFALMGLLASNPLQSLYRLLVYVDVRTRAEGWDLQVALRAAGLSL